MFVSPVPQVEALTRCEDGSGSFRKLLGFHEVRRLGHGGISTLIRGERPLSRLMHPGEATGAHSEGTLPVGQEGAPQARNLPALVLDPSVLPQL